jgi:hypothetical protein
MSSIGELFKFLGANDFFQSLCQNSEKTNQQIVESVFQNDEVITTLKTFVQDENIIKSKMDILIGQKRKKDLKQDLKQDLKVDPEQTVQEPTREFKYVPMNPASVVYLDNFAFIEQIGNKMRLVTHDFEIYY